uniref:Protein FAM33A n=1 Tax=Anthurium amnicola TaxID=1678845 RepID=A0A1D1YI74_9ARAE
MGEHKRQQQWRRHHPALDEVVSLLSKANRDLYAVQHHLDKEFQRTYPDHANPYKIVCRIKKIQEDLEALKEMCRELLAEKQDLIDKARVTLVGQRSSLQRLLASSNLPLISDDDGLAYANLNQIIDEWSAQVKAKTGEIHDRHSEDINQMLFSSIVQDG